MANPIKGEVSFESNGQTYIFKLGTNAQALLEDRVKMSMPAWFKKRGENFSAGDIRLIMWAGLYRQHKLTEEDVGDLIDDIGAEKAGEIFMQAVNLSASRLNGGESNPSIPAKERIGMNS